MRTEPLAVELPSECCYPNRHGRALSKMSIGSVVSVTEVLEAERELVDRLVSGDEEAFSTLVHSHAAGMLALAKRLTNSEPDAADCVQESFTVLFHKIDSFEGRSSLKTWLHRIVVNQALMKMRKKNSLREQSLDQYQPRYNRYGLLIGPIRTSEESVESLVSKKETAAKVRSAIAELPDTYRVILIMRDLEGYTTAETAELMQIAEGAVRTRIHRARHALKKILEPEMDALYLGDTE